MKRGKEHDEQQLASSMGPMFPRLHVNDAAEKGGPRAPPRNKMALYEQLSIPSRRFNHELLHLNHRGISNVPPPASSFQGNGYDRNKLYPLRFPPAPAHLSVEANVRKSDAAKTSISTSLLKPRKRAHAEEDLTVPVYDCFRADPCGGQSRSSSFDHSVKTLTASVKDSRHDCESVSLTDSQNPEATDHHRANSHRLGDEPLVGNEKRNGSKKTTEPYKREFSRMSNEVNNDHCGLARGRTKGTLLIGVRQKADAVSETSMIYSVSGVDVSPDDVVGIIGQKQFWKARRALLNQQRVFAVQVFELHRLIKVQRLIAESSHLLLEDVSPNQALLQNKLNNEATKSPVENYEHKEDMGEHARTIKRSTENTVSKTSSFSSAIRSHHHPLLRDTHSNPFWAHHHQQLPPNHQWLIPIMSPSEGLVYKPYPGPQYMGPAYGVPPYFPTYGAPINGPDFSASSVDQIHHRSHQLSEEDSCNDARWIHSPTQSEKFQESDVQGSSLSEGLNEGVRGPSQVHLTARWISSGGSEPLPENLQQPTQVIKVIPHNRRSATESAAWIFRSIQEERKLYD